MKAEIKKERTYLFSPNIQVSVMAVIQGRAEQRALEETIRITCSKNEMLRCRIRLNDGCTVLPAPEGKM